MKKIIQLYQGKVLDLQRETWELPDRREAEFEIVRHPGGAAILPILPNGRLLLLKQFRPAANGFIVEIPAGRLEAGEVPQQCAVRELQEETGWRADEVTPLGMLFSTPGFCDEQIHLFLAERLTPDIVNREPDEFIELFEIDLAGALEMLERGEIPDSKTQLAILNYARRARSG
jgi:ADP-ribose diphosphatase